MEDTTKAREPNSHECMYYGRNLSESWIDSIQSNVSGALYPDKSESSVNVSIGSDRDEEIYFNCKPPEHKTRKGKLIPIKEMLKERVLVFVDTDNEAVEIDLEDILRFAAERCRGIYNRVGYEVKAYDCEDIDMGHLQAWFKPVDLVNTCSDNFMNEAILGDEYNQIVLPYSVSVAMAGEVSDD